MRTPLRAHLSKVAPCNTHTILKMLHFLKPLIEKNHFKSTHAKAEPFFVICKFDVGEMSKVLHPHYIELDALAWKKFLSLQCLTTH